MKASSNADHPVEPHEDAAGAGRRGVRSGLKWIAISSTLAKLAQFGSMLLVARILGREAVGLVAMAGAALMFIGAIRRNGIGQAFISYRAPDADAEQLAANTQLAITLATNLLLFLVMYACVPWIADFFAARPGFDEPRFTVVLRVLLLGFLIEGWSTTPDLVLQKRLQFRSVAIAEVCSAVGQAAIMLGLALAGFGIWSLVAGQLASQVVRLLVIYRLCEWRPTLRISLRIAGELVRFGKYMWAFGAISAAGGVLDRLVAGRLVGQASLGDYSIAFRLCHLPAVQVAELVNRVSYPVYAHLQHDVTALRRAMLKSMRLVAILVMPLAFGLNVVAGDAVQVILGPQWADTADVVEVLAFYGATLATSAVMGPVFMAMGRPSVLMYNSLAHHAVLVVLLLTLGREGIVGIAYAVLATALASSALAALVACRLLDLRATELLAPLVRSCASSAIMYVAVRGLQASIARPAVVELALAVGLGFLTYWLVTRILNRTQFHEVLRTLGEVRRAR